MTHPVPGLCLQPGFLWALGKDVPSLGVCLTVPIVTSLHPKGTKNETWPFVESHSPIPSD